MDMFGGITYKVSYVQFLLDNLLVDKDRALKVYIWALQLGGPCIHI